MSRYIDADKLYPDKLTVGGSLAISQSQIAEQPTADVRENVHGEWIVDGHHMRCNNCNEYMCNTDREGDPIPKNYCPNCGAKMRGEKNG